MTLTFGRLLLVLLMSCLLTSGCNDDSSTTLDPLADPLAPGGTVTVDGTEYDVAELSAQSAGG